VTTFAVIPVLVGPLQVLVAVLPAILIALGTTAIALFKPSTMKKLVKLLWRLKWQVLPVLVGLVALVWGGRWACGKLGPAAGALEGGTDWPLVRGSLARTGAAPGTKSPNSGGIIWQHKKGNEAFFASPAVVGNRVFVSVADMAALGQSGRIYAFDADTGRIAWTGRPEGYEPTFSSPVVSGNYVVCGEGLHWAKTARIVCLDLLTGKVVWTVRTKSHVECAPVIEGERVFIGAGDDGYYCVDLKTGKELWHVPGEKYPDAETGLVVHDGKVYAGLGEGGSAICVLEAATGKELQRVKMPYPVFAPPTIANGKLYIGMGKGDYVNAGVGGEVRCLDLATLKTDWTFPLEMTVLGSVAVAGNDIVFASRDGRVYRLNPAGKLAAKFDAHVPISAAPAVTEQYVYVVTEAGLLLGLKRDTLEPVWDFRLGTKPLFISAPTVARGHVYVGTQNDGFLCVGEPGQATAVATANDGSPLPGSGAFLWQYPADQQGGSNCFVTGRCVGLGKDLYAPLVTGNVRLAVGTEAKAEAVKTMPATVDGPIEIRNEAGAIVALDRATHRSLWRVSANAVTPGTIVKDRCYIGTASALECRSVLDGKLIWSRATTPQPGIPPLISRGQLLFATKDALLLLDLESADAKPALWMDTSWLGPVCGPMTLKDSHVFAPITGWGVVCLGAAK
jgi:outer membrane protein assembly factor BamB